MKNAFAIPLLKGVYSYTLFHLHSNHMKSLKILYMVKKIIYYNGAKELVYVCMYVYMCVCMSSNSSQSSDQCIANLGMGTQWVTRIMAGYFVNKEINIDKMADTSVSSP